DAVAPDLEALGRRQEVRRVLREGVPAPRPVPAERYEADEAGARDGKIGAARIVRVGHRVHAAVESRDALLELQRGIVAGVLALPSEPRAGDHAAQPVFTQHDAVDGD